MLLVRGGWTGKILRVDLTKRKYVQEPLDAKMAVDFLGGRGFAVKILWDELSRGVDPLSPDNLLVMATGPLTGLPIPSSGKIQVAAKSPLTGGYGDGNIGTKAAVQLKKAGYDVLVVRGRAEKPSIIKIEDDSVEIMETDLWGRDTWETQDELERKYGKNAGILLIGPAGERLVKFAVVMSEKGRSGGRPGIGAVMGSKNLKAVVIKGSKEIPVADKKAVEALGAGGYKEVKSSKSYDLWIRQGTMVAFQWCQENSTLPTMNFSEGIFDYAENLNGDAMEKYYKIGQKGCPNCNMPCGNLNKIKEGPYKDDVVEIDYENIGMLGPNLGIGNMNYVLSLNLLADKMGMDTISLGGTLAFVTEAYQRGLIGEDQIGLKPEWGNGEKYLRMAEMIARREGFGDLMAEGSLSLAKRIGKGAEKFAIQVKGLEVSAYECHTLHGMALAYGTSPIGAHHKDAWFISIEIAEGRDIINKEKVEKLITMQRRRSFFENATTCRLPWVEVGFNLDWYPKFLRAATGLDFTWDDLYQISDRTYALIRAFWVREFGEKWGRHMDYPPEKWFTEPYTKGPYAGRKLDRDKYDQMLSWYYELRGWDERGIPRKSTLAKLGLDYVAVELEKVVKLSE
ncbi:MAG: aldehyde ferredoxin oxidoreductase [Thermoproteota archaeon]|uniref:Aldehyde ferredoxin oxidoreductase n=1 Tax=Candidatus Methanodesulfokora washburnensis TaxID=2478471 RepID=A0A520KIK0_9CREN|nr:MAG: aldehyde ferredoxin oxidoreductase [Candidatus Methanodesulfokores washburnensis]TDA41456.1 MAG: aldehyde ferredoxin oxidoreductase [Candidatus Korarchaeota archaeon]